MKRVLLSLLALSACGLDGGDVCDASFLSIYVTVIDTLGAPVDSVTATVRLLRTGAVLHPNANDPGPAAGGGFLLANDADLRVLGPGGDDVAAVVTKGTLSAHGAYLLADGGCHVSKVAGPDTLVLGR
jgi:hypothetical protein